MIGTAAIPITALSAKLISMNRNNRATISRAPFGVSVWWIVATPRDRATVCQIRGLADREGWTLIGNSCIFWVPVSTQGYGTYGYRVNIGHETVRHPRAALRRASGARAH